ncbi:MAG: hypothetical protein DMF03_07480 [Verrucomicrobia bacterium]|nr:MAG: hypothetical protein DMF03_07480 [Verrucomicrobiota bacterium]
MPSKLHPFSPMKKLSASLLAALTFALVSTALATTVIPPTFDDLVTHAEMIFQGTVTDVRSQWTGEGGQRHIESYVTFKVEDAIKGNPGAKVTLNMMGGTVGAETMEVSDAPKFKVGDRDILFVENNGTQFIPLVGIMHGRFRVQKDETGRDVVLTNDGAPLTDVNQLGKNERAATAGRAISTQEFKQALQSRVGHSPP